MTVAATTARPLRGARTKTAEDIRLRRVRFVWMLLFFNVLPFTGASVIPLPHRVGQLLTQGALLLALFLALSVNPKVQIRPSVFLTLYAVLAIISLAMSIRFIGIGTTFRAFRLVVFLAVLWLLTPWWGRRDLFLLRSQLRVLVLVLVSTIVGLLLAPHKAFAVNFGTRRLYGALWPIYTTQLAHYMADLTAVCVLLWMCGLLSRRFALLAIVPGLIALIATHTRTALVAMVVGLIVGALSLFTSQRRVRKALVTVAMLAVIVAIPLSGFLGNWLIRGESNTQVNDLSGRTQVWTVVFSEPKPETNKIFGSGLSNGGVVGALNSTNDGLPIDSGWISTYQDQGIVGIVLEGTMFLVLLTTALLRPRGPAKAIALYLIVYCLLASFTETGLGEASTYLLNLALAASLLMTPVDNAPSLAPGLA